MITDLVSPWLAAVEAADPETRRAFLQHHASLLAELGAQHAPDHPLQPLGGDTQVLRRLARDAGSADTIRRVHESVVRAAAMGADVAIDVVLFAGNGRGPVIEPLPWRPVPLIAVFVENVGRGGDGGSAVAAAVARGAAMVSRWRADDSSSTLARQEGAWNRWELCREVSLAEWVYTEGVAARLAVALEPATPLHVILGLSRTGLARLREGERLLRQLLERDLDLPGLGPVLRWLADDIGPAQRTIDGHVIPAGAGRYLGYRMTEARIESAGMRAALRAPSAL